MNKSTTAASNVIPFDFDKKPVRTLLIDDQPWFAAKDIISALDYSKSSNPTKLIEHVPAQWKGVNPIHTPGGIQKLLMLSEQGLYFFLGRSDKPQALPFQMWLAGEVLPAIRKHGRYVDDSGKLDTLLGSTIGTNGFNMLSAVIKGKVAALPKEVRRQATMKIWSQTHTAFGVRSAQDIPADQLDAARNFVAAYALEGEWLPKAKDEEFVLDFWQAQEVCHLLHHTIWCVYRWNTSMAAGVKSLNYETWLNAFEHFEEASRSARRIERLMPEMIGHFRGKHGGLLPEDFAARGIAA